MKSSRSALVLAHCVLLGFLVYLFFPLLKCVDRCFVDFISLHGRGLGLFESPDTRLNAWILAWVQHGLITQPLQLFNANVLYPAPNMLAGSEHMIGLAVLTLPLRLFTSNAILVYQLTMMLTSVILVMTTFALVRWLTGSLWASFLAGAMVLFMPWRISGLTHLQILGAHWFPLIWLLTFRILIGPARRRDAALLSVVLTLQLLSSYYLAYMVMLSLAFLFCVVGLQAGLKIRSVYRLSIAAIAPCALLFLTSIPYLERRTRGEIFTTLQLENPPNIEQVAKSWSFVAPRLETAWSDAPTLAYTYSVPLIVAVLGLIALMFSLTRGRGEEGGGRQRAAIVSLWICVLGAFVMMLGPQIRLGEFVVKLPEHEGAAALGSDHRNRAAGARRPRHQVRRATSSRTQDLADRDFAAADRPLFCCGSVVH
jgi:hypothetical protein